MLQTDTIEAMGMPFTIRYRVARPQALDQVTATIAAWLKQVEADFSPFKPDSLVCRMQRGELPISAWTADMQEVYGIATRARTVTAGAFDPWFAGHYDPTGVVKGWAIQRAFERYLQPLLTGTAVSAVALNGAGDIQMGVAAGSDFRWGVGVADPTDAGRTIYRYELTNAAIATSGFSERGNHIRLQTAQATLMQASVVAPELIGADVWATAALAMGETEYASVATKRGHTAVVVTPSHALRVYGGGSHV